MRSLMLSLVVVAAFGCAPKSDLPVAEITKLDKLDKVMDVQATIADPQFKKIGQASYTDVDWAQFTDVGNRIVATTDRIKAFSKGPGFDALAVELQSHAKELIAAADGKNAAAAGKALADMKATCKSCHKQFR